MSEQIVSALAWARSCIAVRSESPRLDAELLLAFCLGKPRSYLYTRPDQVLSESVWQRFQELVRKRLEPTPIAYLIGRREFYSLDFSSTPSALVPRPETELLVELALEQIPIVHPWRICDLGTGSGIIAITLKKQRPLASVFATDVDPACLLLARENAARHEVDIEFIESDWYRQLPTGLAFDLIASNPPYIAANNPFLQQGDLPAEPELALTPGDTGLEALQQIIRKAKDHMVIGGYLVLEHGYDQQASVAELLATHGFSEIRCAKDYNNLPRTSIAKRVDNPNFGA